MLKTYLYIPDQLETQIQMVARASRNSKAEVMRKALHEGLQVLNQQKKGGAEVLLELAEMARKLKVKGPRDAAVNHDYYLWGMPKRNSRIKP